MGIFTLQHGLALSLLVAPIFSPCHSAKSIMLQCDTEGHVFFKVHFFRSLRFCIKGIKLRHLEGGEFYERSSGRALECNEEDPLGGNTQRQIFLRGNRFWP